MKSFKLLICFAFLFLQVSFAQQIPARPNPPRLVNDFAGVLSPDQKEALERKLVEYDDSTSVQIVIVTIKTTGDYDEQQFALKILRDWGVGNKSTNNGLVLLAVIDDRKVRIETGYGLEGAVPDIIAKRIIENDIIPAFKSGNFYRGFDEATSSIMSAVKGEYQAPEGYRNRGKATDGSKLLMMMAVMLIVLWILSKSGGSGGGGMMSRRGYRGWGGPTVWWFPTGGGGGFSGGGGGFSGGGGFGGFGGGSGGGGGASGSW
jgi:uncharacterized protein